MELKERILERRDDDHSEPDAPPFNVDEIKKEAKSLARSSDMAIKKALDANTETLLKACLQGGGE